MAVYTQLQESDIREIAGSYDLTVVDYEPVAAGAANSNYFLWAQQGSYVLTVFEDNTFDQVVELGELLLLLEEFEFPAPCLLPPSNGGIASMHRGKPLMLKVYIDGQVYKNLDKIMLYQVGAAMARLHQVPALNFLSDRQPYGLQKYPSIQGQSIDVEYEDWITKRLPHLEQQKPQGLPRGLVHSDMFYDNVLFESKVLKALIDFEEALCYDKVFDLGMGIIGLCRRGSVVVLEKARALVKGYQQVRELEEGEKKALQLFVEYAATTVSCWRYWKYHIDAPNVEKADKHRKMMHVAEGVRDISKARFLETVFS